MTTALGLWFGVTAVVLTFAFVPHATYFAVVALPLALLAVVGGVDAIRLYRTARGREWLVLPILVGVQLLWSEFVILSGPGQLRWLAPVAGTAALVSIVLLVVLHHDGGVRMSLTRSTIALAVVSALLAPTAWSLCVLGPGGGGSASDAFAGPRMPSPTAPAHAPLVGPAGGIRAPFAGRSAAGLSTSQRRLRDYITPRNRGRELLFATDTMAIAVSFILDPTSAKKAMPMGGFSRQAANPQPTDLRELVRSGRLRFVLLSVPVPHEVIPPNPTLQRDRTWVRENCRPVLIGRFRDKSILRQRLFDCVPAYYPASDQAGAMAETSS